MFKELLPIGSVVLLKGGSKKLMIIGIMPFKKDEPEKTYDYIAVLYPEGFLGEEGNYMFNNSDINDIIYIGYHNPEREAFITRLEKIFAEE